MNPLDVLAERRILEAQRLGEFDDLPGRGEPLDLDDDALVPEELRVAYRVLKNAGFVPPEVAALRELRELEQLLDREPEAAARSALVARIAFLIERCHHGSMSIDAAYSEKVARKLAARR